MTHIIIGIVCFIIGALCGLIVMALCAIGKISDQVMPQYQPRESSGDDRNITGGDA